jgi:anaerobic selenocysteine-containing dehydrogenase
MGSGCGGRRGAEVPAVRMAGVGAGSAPPDWDGGRWRFSMVKRDRIADPWGSRTPYAAGEAWPTRVDSFLDDGLTADQVERWVPSASILHSNGDAMDVAVTGGRMVGVRGCAASRVNHGRLGPKDLFGWQANASADRLRRPLCAGTAGSSSATGTAR